MIYVIDDFFENSFYKKYSDKLKGEKNTAVLVGDKVFHIQYVDEYFTSDVVKKLEKIENKKINPILSFFRCATDDLDTDWRIHSDYIINGVNPDRACVIYMSKSQMECLNGTAFWQHETYGDKLPDNTTIEEYNRMLIEESEDLSKWELKSVVGGKENRLVSYPANYFHSKYPSRAWKEGRYVFVMFYSII